jgi:hypothetical protein
MRNGQRQNLPGMQAVQGTGATWGCGIVMMRVRFYVCASYIYNYIFISQLLNFLRSHVTVLSLPILVW